jgi:hypothetical protein
MGVIALSSRQAGPSAASNDDPILSKSGLLVSTYLFESIADLPVLQPQTHPEAVDGAIGTCLGGGFNVF